MISQKVAFYFILLQVLIFCSGEEVTVVIDTEAQLTGSTQDALYMDSASQVPTGYVPEEIRDSDGVGYWLFTSSSQDSLISLEFQTTFRNFELKYYNTETIECYFQDLAQDETEVKIVLPASQNSEWSIHKFEIERVAANEAVVNFRIVFPNEFPLAFFLLDSISYTSDKAEATSTIQPTTPSSPEPTTQPDSGIITTVMDTEEQLTGSISEAFYVVNASQIPAEYLPEEIINSDGVGFWLFSSAIPGGNISLYFDTTFLEISLTYYNTAPIECHFRDWALSETEETLTLPTSQNNEWTTMKFALERSSVDDAQVTFSFVFPTGEEPPFQYFLLDSITYSTAITAGSSTTPSDENTTTPSDENTTTPSDEKTTTPSDEKTTTPSDEKTTTDGAEVTTYSKSSATNPAFALLITIVLITILGQKFQ